MRLQDWSDIADVVVAVATVAGVLLSIWLSTKALREVQADRAARQAPFVMFEPRGNYVPVQFEKAGKAIPGINPAYVAEVFSNLPTDAESVRVRGEPFYGNLRNHGNGPALNVRVLWIAKAVSVKGERFTVDDAKRQEPIYSETLNRLPAWPSNIPPSGDAQLTRLPTFIEKDIDKKVTSAEGVLAITCRDLGQGEHCTYQEFRIFPSYGDEEPHLIVTFGSLLETPEDFDSGLRSGHVA